MTSDVSAGNRLSKARVFFEILSTLAMIVLAGAVVWEGRARLTRGSAQPSVLVPNDPITFEREAALGMPSAKIAIIEYSDFQCPFCGVVARGVVPALIRDYVQPGKALFVFKNLPLPIHPLAMGAAAAAHCAGQQNKFLEMHDLLFGAPSKLADVDLKTAATQIGLDVAAFDSCRNTPSTAKAVQADASEAAALKISGTPTFFFGKVEERSRVRVSSVLSGAKPIEDFKKVIDPLLK